MPYERGFILPGEGDTPYQQGDARVWVKPERDDLFGFLGCFAAGGFSWPQPDITPVWCPDPARSRKFVKVDEIEGAPSFPTTSIMGRTHPMAFLFELVRRGCPFPLDVRFTRCGRPDDPEGWELIRRFCMAHITDYSSDDQVVINESGETMETAALTAETMYMLYKLLAEERDAGLNVNFTAVAACDQLSCGDCAATPSGGCLKWIIGTEDFGGVPNIGITTDGGTTWTFRPITPWVLGEHVSDLACIGGRIIVITANKDALAYSDDEGVTWTQVTAGFLAGGSGRALFALDPRHIWIAGEAGAIYFTDNPTLGVVVQEDGTLTARNLNDIYFTDSQRGYCVGDGNTFLYTTNGGDTWLAGLGPEAGVDLTSLYAVRTKYMDMVLVGTSNGHLWQSFDAGATWAQRVLPGTGTFNIASLAGCGCAGLEMFALRETGTYLAPTGGELFRTIDGGISWQEIDLPTNVGVEDVACCSPNMAIVVGTQVARGTGFLAVVGNQV